MYFTSIRKNIAVTIFFLSSSYSLAYAQTDPCSTLADMQSKSDATLFVGYGSGPSQKESDQNAQIDLARNIRQKVTASSAVEESNQETTLKASSKSVVSEILIGAKVLKRCPNNSSFSTVVTLEKANFISSLNEKLTTNIKKAVSLNKAISTAKTEEILAQQVESSKKFLADYQENFEADLELCKVYKGCANLNSENAIQELSELVAKQGDKDQYLLVTNEDKVSTALRENIITLLEADNIKIMDESVSEDSKNSKRKIRASCKAKVGSKIPGSNDRIVETTCTVEAYIGKQKKFRKVFSCKATADAEISTDDAVSSCSGRLQLE
ncbi:LPP20 family lipoprotein [Silvanigrella aquatica]|uniref:LPP20 lipoprotein n=1 Tax=Silvanigrella aquatica TaxID=1915309 RepID=A0A1L4CYU8_9BACT|nr:LPP20 family lipoprotein [Silvanigrella aquatica]APJ03107.1 hypothetical protein AXG55_03965 [Silvanigrella aquatica]